MSDMECFKKYNENSRKALGELRVKKVRKIIPSGKLLVA